MPRGALPTIDAIPPEVLAPYLRGEIGYREVARRMDRPRNTVLRALVRLGHTAGRAAERWRPVAGTGGRYRVSDHGRVARVLTATGRPCHRVLRPQRGGGRHPYVVFSEGGATRSAAVARVVAAAFLPPPPASGAIVRHRDGDSRNCRAANLYWSTWSRFHRDSPTFRVLTRDQAAAIRSRKGRSKATELASEFGVGVRSIYKIWREETWKEPPDDD